MTHTGRNRVVMNLMEITNRVIDYQGTATLGNVQQRYANAHRLSVGEDFILDTWRQAGLNVIQCDGEWMASRMTPSEKGPGC